MSKWSLAAELLQEAANTIKSRGTLRDVDGYADTMEAAAKLSGVDERAVLGVHIATKRVRFDRAGDYDSAVDLLAYYARQLVLGVRIDPKFVPEMPDALAKDADDDTGLSAGSAIDP